MENKNRYMALEQSETITFTAEEAKELSMKYTVMEVYNALKEKGYNPINQIVGYILSEDPTYITSYKNARNLIRKIDRDELLAALLTFYIDNI